MTLPPPFTLVKEMKNLEEKILMARAKKKAPLVFKNARVVDVFSNKIIKADLAVADGYILGFGSYEGAKEIDLGGKIICPSLTDGHMHIESTMVRPSELAKVLLVNGVTTLIADPHEIANVLGLDGIKYMLEASKDLPIDIRFMLPSCVPATGFENSGARLSYKELKKLKGEEKVLGLGEMMNYVGLLENDRDVLEKLEGFEDMPIDGHAPFLAKEDLNAYRFAGVLTDHECSTIEEMDDRISRGMAVQIRQGSSAKNAETLSRGITKDNLSSILFCTDDKHPKDLLEKGSVNENIKIAIKNGLDPIDAIKIGSINPAKTYGLEKKGALAPGYEANFIVLDSLEDFEINSVYVRGLKYTDRKKVLVDFARKDEDMSLGKVKIYDYELEDLQIRLKSNMAHVIGINPNELITENLIEEVGVEDGLFKADSTYQKIIVVERHKGLKSMGKGIIKGFGIKNGAFGQSIAHDSHNIIIVGDNDEDIYLAMKEIQKMNGGLVVVKDQKVLETLPLEIGGLMSSLPIEETAKRVDKIVDLIHDELDMDNKDLDPLLTLGFMSLPVIPKIKITDKGLFDVEKFEFIDINA